MVAIFTVAGCKPTTPSTPTPTATPTATPTVAPDKACPKVVSTVVSKIYDANNPGAFKIVITFDEPIESDCIENPDNWAITVSNSGRQDTKLSATPYDVEISGKKLIVKATVEENVTYSAVYIGGTNGSASKVKTFYGLICNTEDAENYADYKEVLNIPTGAAVISSSPAKPTVADVVSWELNGCFIYDELGNGCCTYSGEDCCLEPICETCVEECPLGTCQ